MSAWWSEAAYCAPRSVLPPAGAAAIEYPVYPYGYGYSWVPEASLRIEVEAERGRSLRRRLLRGHRRRLRRHVPAVERSSGRARDRVVARRLPDGAAEGLSHARQHLQGQVSDGASARRRGSGAEAAAAGAAAGARMQPPQQPMGRGPSTYRMPPPPPPQEQPMPDDPRGGIEAQRGPRTERLLARWR